ncbi:MAG: SusC/RagA family TonB-linked outer membrane protein [Candidatus Cryptobacteroides sp.]
MKGRITDDTAQALAGVIVSIDEKQVFCSSLEDGSFELPAKKGDILNFNCIGLQSTSIQIEDPKCFLNVVMLIDTEMLEETVVVGYGVTRKRDLAGSVSSIKAEDVKAGVITSTADLLRGRAAGVMVKQESFEPGSGMTVRIRGASTISADNTPLYIVDGIQTTLGNQISPEDIESMEILKDAAATAIYGSRGANGVIIITTKHGNSGKLSVDYSYNISVKQLRNPWDLMDASQSIKYEMLNWENNGSAGDPPYTPEEQLYTGKGTDWIKEMTRNSTTQTHALSLQGGSDKIQAAATVVNTNDKGLVLNSDFARTSARLNVDFKPNNFIKAGVNAYMAKTDRTYISMGTKSSTDNAMYWMFLASPLNTIEGKNVFGEETRLENVYYELMYKDLNVRVNNSYLTAYAQMDFLKYFNLRAQYSYNFEMDKYSTYYDCNTNHGAANKGIATQEIENSDYQQAEAVLTYHQTFAKSDLKIIAGSSFIGNNYYYTGMGAHNFTTDAFRVHNMGAAQIVDWISTAKSDKYNLSFFSRLEYVLKDKYIFNASIRADGASNFGASNKWGYFPAASLAWQLGDEPFMEFTKPLFDNIKLRFSYGQTGNDGIGSYKSLRSYAFEDVYLGGDSVVKGMYPANAGNSLLHWETTSQSDIGIDLSLLDHKIEINFDLYSKLTTDLLNDINISTSTGGIQTTKGNNGAISNKGVELFINYHVFDTADFSWTSTLNISHNKNTVESISAPTFYSLRPHGSYADTEYAVIQEVLPLSSIWGYEWIGIIQEGETYAPQPKSQPGDPKFRDIDGSGTIDENDRTFLGQGDPNIFFGWGNTIRWKDFDFTIFIDGSFGNSLLNVSRVVLEDNNRLAVCLNRWTRNNPSENIIRGTWKRDGGLQYGSFVNSHYVEDASYLRLSNLEIGYNIPVKKLKINKYVKGIRAFVGGNRLLTLTRYSGFDPEVSVNGSSAVTQGLDYNAYPAYRQYNAGIKVTF